MIPKEELRKIIIMEKLSDEMFDKIIPTINVLKLTEQEMIFDEGGDAKYFYMLQSGKVLLEKRISDKITVSLGAIKPGFSFGWSSMFGEPYSFMAICAETSEILMINAEKILSLMQEDHSMGFLLMQSLTRMMKNRMDRVEEQFLKAIKEHPDFESLLDE
jgi:CRP/FNR family cyclic AMP-dependent transcriptional regulator